MLPAESRYVLSMDNAKVLTLRKSPSELYYKYINRCKNC